MTSAAYHSRDGTGLVLKILGRATLLVAGLCLAIAVAALVHAELQNRAVVRIALDQVPVERVVEFGHEDGAFAMVMPVPLSSVESIPGGETDRAAMRGADRLQPVAAYVEPDGDGVLPIDFSIEQGFTSASGGVGVTKTIANEQGAMTGLTIFLIGGSIIEIERSELAGALAAIGASERSKALPPAGANGRLSLDRVRQAGLDLRYDAIRDRLVLHP